MLLKLIFFTTLFIQLITSEPPNPRSGPYAAAGWHPQKPFHLPGEYLPPQPQVEIEQQQQRQRPSEIEISKARVDYIGQVQQKAILANNRQPKRQYEQPPNKQQELPYEYNKQQYKPTIQQQQQQFFPKQEQIERKPAQKYGPPQSPPSPPQFSTSPQSSYNFNIIYPDPRNFEENSFANRGGGDVADFIAVEDNQEAQDFDAFKPPVRAKQGQYFVLGPDNTVQRVIFTTSQDEDERRSNGFTAKLKYTPIGELKDPVFRYNNKGQLIRVLKK